MIVKNVIFVVTKNKELMGNSQLLGMRNDMRYRIVFKQNQKTLNAHFVENKILLQQKQNIIIIFKDVIKVVVGLINNNGIIKKEKRKMYGDFLIL